MALPVHLPCDGSVLRTNFIASGGSCSGASVVRHVGAILTFNDHATHEVRIKVIFIIDDRENLSLDTDTSWQVCQQINLTFGLTIFAKKLHHRTGSGTDLECYMHQPQSVASALHMCRQHACPRNASTRTRL